MSYTKLAATGVLALLMSSGAVMADTWRYAFEEALEEVQGKFAQKFKEEVEANSDHSVQLFPFGTLGESADIMEQAQAGILQFVDQSPGFTGALIPEAQVFFVPYLLPQDEETLATFFEESKAINEMFPPLYAEQGLELLTMFPEGEVMMTTTEPVEGPADLNEVKFRVMTNPLLVESYQAFGATPTPLPWGEVYGGLQTGIIDGQENPIFWIESGGLYEVSPHLTFTGHGWFTTAMMANQDFYEGLSDEDKELVQEASNAAYDHTIEHIKGLADDALAKIQEASDEVTVTRLNEEQIQAFRERAPQVEEAFLEMTGDRGEELLQQFKADLEAVNSDS